MRRFDSLAHVGVGGAGLDPGLQVGGTVGCGAVEFRTPEDLDRSPGSLSTVVVAVVNTVVVVVVNTVVVTVVNTVVVAVVVAVVNSVTCALVSSIAASCCPIRGVSVTGGTGLHICAGVRLKSDWRCRVFAVPAQARCVLCLAHDF